MEKRLELLLGFYPPPPPFYSTRVVLRFSISLFLLLGHNERFTKGEKWQKVKTSVSGWPGQSRDYLCCAFLLEQICLNCHILLWIFNELVKFNSSLLLPWRCGTFGLDAVFLRRQLSECSSLGASSLLWEEELKGKGKKWEK